MDRQKERPQKEGREIARILAEEYRRDCFQACGLFDVAFISAALRRMSAARKEKETRKAA